MVYEEEIVHNDTRNVKMKVVACWQNLNRPLCSCYTRGQKQKQTAFHDFCLQSREITGAKSGGGAFSDVVWERFLKFCMMITTHQICTFILVSALLRHSKSQESLNKAMYVTCFRFCIVVCQLKRLLRFFHRLPVCCSHSLSPCFHAARKISKAACQNLYSSVHQILVVV